MGYEQRSGDIILFRNDRKKNPNEPDLRGQGIDLEGNNVEISLWAKEGRNGPFWAGNMKPKNERQNSYGGNRPDGGGFRAGTDTGRAEPANTEHGKAKANAYVTDVPEDDVPF